MIEKDSYIVPGLFKDKEVEIDKETGEVLGGTIISKSGRVIRDMNASEIQKEQAKQKRRELEEKVYKLYYGDDGKSVKLDFSKPAKPKEDVSDGLEYIDIDKEMEEAGLVFKKNDEVSEGMKR